jgi:stage V sporulation protein B
LGLFVLAEPILALVFPGHNEGYPILRYLSVSIPFIVIFQTSTSILQGVDRYRVPVRNLMVGCIVKFIITFMLVPIANINIYGAIIGTTVGYIISSIMNLRTLEKAVRIKINYYDIIIKPAYASVLMIIAVIFIYQESFNIFLSNGLACIISIFSGLLIYSILIIIFKIMSYEYVRERLRRDKRREL